jgi:hypothetical protein
MAIVVYVVDVLFYGPDDDEMEKVKSELQLDGFELKRENSDEDNAYDFLGIHIEQNGDEIKLTQLGLIEKFLSTVGMLDCNAKQTPCAKTPLGTNPLGPPHDEKWEYASAVGMLMYLAGNAYPEIQFAVHQCARFSHAPKKTHTQAVKCIAHYLKGILDKKHGLIFHKSMSLVLDCYVDADFAGLWGYEDDQDPVCVKSRTGYVMTVEDCPVHWRSKLQTEIALSTLEAEYIALAQALRELIPMWQLFDELMTNFGIQGAGVTVKSTIFEDNNGAIATATSQKLTPRTKHIAIKYHFVKQYFGHKNSSVHPFQLKKIDTSEQKADIFTKGLNAETFLQLRNLLCHY